MDFVFCSSGVISAFIIIGYLALLLLDSAILPSIEQRNLIIRGLGQFLLEIILPCSLISKEYLLIDFIFCRNILLNKFKVGMASRSWIVAMYIILFNIGITMNTTITVEDPGGFQKHIQTIKINLKKVQIKVQIKSF